MNPAFVWPALWNLDRFRPNRPKPAGGRLVVALTTGLTPFGIGGGLDADVLKGFFEIVDDEASRPVFLHCRRGADRTGTLVAIYRIARQGWSVQAAYSCACTAPRQATTCAGLRHPAPVIPWLSSLWSAIVPTRGDVIGSITGCAGTAHRSQARGRRRAQCGSGIR